MAKSQWGIQISNFQNEIATEHKKHCISIENYLYNQIRKNSPVRTGAFRANHNRTFGSPDLTSFSKDKTSGREPQLRSPKNFDDYFITNNAPYANRLENEGWSNQAPVGVYKVAVNSARRKFS